MREFSFSSECPHCKQECSQYGYDAEHLRECLRAGVPIAAYCPACDAGWDIPFQERAVLAVVVMR